MIQWYQVPGSERVSSPPLSTKQIADLNQVYFASIMLEFGELEPHSFWCYVDEHCITLRHHMTQIRRVSASNAKKTSELST